jgi:Ribosomal protein L7/L12 C-terminal domain
LGSPDLGARSLARGRPAGETDRHTLGRRSGQARDWGTGDGTPLAHSRTGALLARALVDEAPKPVREEEGVDREGADKLRPELEEAGDSVEVK